MSVVVNTDFARRPVETDAAFPSQPWESQTARFVAHWGRSGAVINGQGEIDASNAGQLADYVQRCACYCEWVVLDLSALDFFGTAGFSTLHKINDWCVSAEVGWALVPGPTVERLQRICEPSSALPMTESVSVALAKVQSGPLL